jgi:hypothetical protein
MGAEAPAPFGFAISRMSVAASRARLNGSEFDVTEEPASVTSWTKDR